MDPSTLCGTTRGIENGGPQRRHSDHGQRRSAPGTTSTTSTHFDRTPISSTTAGVSHPGLALMIEPNGDAVLYGAPGHRDDVIWHGPHPTLADHAEAAGTAEHADIGGLAGKMSSLPSAGVDVHYLPPYRVAAPIRSGESIEYRSARGRSSDVGRAGARRGRPAFYQGGV